MASRLRTCLRGLSAARLARPLSSTLARWREPWRRMWRLPALLMLGGLSAVLGSGAHAVGLGEVSVNSALNQRLEATIPLIDIGDLQPEELRVTLASAEDFERVGVERFFFLNDLRFRVEVGRNGGLVLVTSEIPVTEPYLNFLVQLQWPQGRLLKEFTILLDPPTYSQAPAPAVRSAVQAAPDVTTTGAIERPLAPVGATAERAAREPASAPVSRGRAAGERVGDEYRMGDGGETLWGIASRHRPSSAVSVQQTMLAIQRLNPDAFVDGNINRLKWGQTLRLPDEAEASAVSAAEALEQVALQDRDWRSGVATAAPGVPQPAATERAAIDATPERADSAPSDDAEGRLRIVAGSDEGGAGGGAKRAETAAPAAAAGAGAGEDLAAALEERDRLSLEVADLTSELDREKELAANQLAVKERQIEVKDRQIAEMQAELARLRAAEGATPGEENQDQSASGPAAAWWQSPAVIGAGAGVLVLLLALALLSARRRRAAGDVLEQSAGAASAVTAPSLARVERAAAPAAPTEPSLAAAPVAAAAAAATVAATAMANEPEAEPEVASSPEHAAEGAPGDELVDVIGEADIYVAYGRYGQAVSLLQNALGEDPDRHEVRLKLLEVYAETGDRESFDREQAELESRCGDEMTLSAAATLAGQFSTGAEPVGMPTLDDLDLPVAAAPEAGAFEPGLPEVALEEVTLDEVALPEAGAAEAEALQAGAIEELEFELPDEPLPGDDHVAPGTSAGAASTDAGLEFEFEPPLQEDTWDSAGRPGSAVDPGAPLEIETWSTGSGGTEPPRSELLGGDLGIGFRLEETDLEDLDAEELALEMDGLPQEAGTADETDFEFVDEGDSASTKLDLARAYKEMGDPDGAREILLEVLKEGSEAQQQAARELLDQL